MSTDLMELLHAGTADPDEFEHVLSLNFPSAQQREPDIIEYLPEQNSNESALRLIYAGRELCAIEPGPLLQAGALEKIRTDVEEKCLRPTGTVVARTPLFAALPVDAWWRYRDEFQILPAPPEAPRPNQLLAAHPFTLELRVGRSSDAVIQMLRRDRRVRELELVLGSLIWKIVDSEGQQSNKRWVYLPSEPGEPLRSAFLQVGYEADGIRAFLDEFTPTGELTPMRVVPDDEYFAQEGLRVGDTLAAPNSLQKLIDLCFAAPPGTRDKFMRFSYWLLKADTFWPLSKSGSYVAVVSAIEALMDDPASEGTCSECHREKGPGPTKRFRAFVDKWSSAADAKKLYEVRSAISHGGRLMRWDKPGFPFNPAANAEDEYHRDAFRAARTTGVMWLASASAAQ